MIHPKLSKFNPLRKDVLLRHIKRKTSNMSSIILVEENPDDDKYQTFMVERIGPEVTAVRVGEIVVAPWTNITEPFKLEDDKGNTVSCGITDEKEICYVLEGADEQKI